MINNTADFKYNITKFQYSLFSSFITSIQANQHQDHQPSTLTISPHIYIQLLTLYILHHARIGEKNTTIGFFQSESMNKHLPLKRCSSYEPNTLSQLSSLPGSKGFNSICQGVNATCIRVIVLMISQHKVSKTL